MNRQLSAFTITEISVAMVITSIVAAGATVAIDSMQQASHTWRLQQNEQVSRLYWLGALSGDAGFARAIYFSDSGAVIFTDSGSVTYTDRGGVFRRANGATDSLVSQGELLGIELDSHSRLVDTLILNVSEGEVSYPVCIAKKYAFADIIQSYEH